MLNFKDEPGKQKFLKLGGQLTKANSVPGLPCDLGACCSHGLPLVKNIVSYLYVWNVVLKQQLLKLVKEALNVM